MDKVFQVYVSSTFSDLADERRLVSNTLAKAGYIAAGMELFPATDQQQLDFIKRVIDRSDYYVVILAGRYGSLADDRLSFTEHEYDYARSRSLPILAFLHGDADKIEVGKTDKDPQKAQSLQNFRRKLSTGRLVDFWTDPQDLCTKVLTAVVQTTHLSPGIGWIRGDQAIDPKILQDAERLRLENIELKNRLNEYSMDQLIFPAGLAGPDEMFDFDLSEISYSQTSVYGDRQEVSREIKKVKIEIGAVFVEIFECLLGSPTEYSLQTKIGKAVAIKTNHEEISKTKGYEISRANIESLRFHLEALGLILASVLKGQYTSSIAWEITDKGRRYVTQLKAISTRGRPELQK